MALFWDGSGLVLLAKRLEGGWLAIDSPRVELSASELEDLLSGIDLPRNGRRKHRAQGA
jgi:hypothetical protein